MAARQDRRGAATLGGRCSMRSMRPIFADEDFVVLAALRHVRARDRQVRVARCVRSISGP